MKILIIDDQIDSVQGIIDECADKGWDTKTAEFEGCFQVIADYDPDIIILDWYKDADDPDIGNPILEKIWKNGFRPVIVFSAHAALIDQTEKEKNSIIFKVIEKSDETPVVEYLDKIAPYVSAITDYRNGMNEALIEGLNAVEMFFRQDNFEGDNIIKYILSKRTASYFDIQFTEEKMPPWCQYIYPALGESLCVGDVLRVISKNGDLNKEGKPEEYCVILTPSCDMVKGRPKVKHVLIANCYNKETFYQSNIKAEDPEELTKLIVSVLNKGYNDRWVALPQLQGVFPHLTINLKKIRLIDLDKIAVKKEEISENDMYVRVASVDSPFREQIVWAHMQNSCRPGVPDRDTENWAKEITTK